MDELYYDDMTICSKVEFLDLFITFTCNPNWPEIQKVLGHIHLKPQDRLDIIARIFKIKFDNLLTYVTNKCVLDKVLTDKLNIPTLLSIITFVISFSKLFNKIPFPS